MKWFFSDFYKFIIIGTFVLVTIAVNMAGYTPGAWLIGIFIIGLSWLPPMIYVAIVGDKEE